MQISYFEAKLHPPSSILAGAALQTLLGELTALPRLPSWIYGAYTYKGKEREGKKWK